MTEASDFFPRNRIAVLAHRGLALRDDLVRVGVRENSIAAFRAALDAGADVLECDVRATRDGIAVFAHDETLQRVFGISARVCDLSYDEITRLIASAGISSECGVTSVTDALNALPNARFNIDVKESNVIEPLARAVVEARATRRVLITSFSGRRRRRTVRRIAQLTGKTVATSGSADTVAGVVLLCWFGCPGLARRWARGVRILQIPERALGIATSTARMLRLFHRAGFTVHFWTINDVDSAGRLARVGADGLVSDRSDSLVAHFRAG